MDSGSPELGALFPGFHDPRRYYTQVPDYLFDFLMRDLKGSELKVVYYVARHTFGFLRDDAAISWSRFLEGTVSRDGRRLDWGAGVSRRALKESLDALLEKGLLYKERRSSAGRGDEASSYSLRIRPHQDEEPPRDLEGHWGFRLMPHSTGVPNQLFDVLLSHLTEGELKVLSYLIRRTLGMKQEIAEVSYAQFSRGIATEDGRALDRGTGLSERTVQNAIAGLVAKRCIRRFDPDPERGPSATYAYRLRTADELDAGSKQFGGDRQEVSHGGSRKYHGGVEKRDTGMGSRKYHTGVAERGTHERQCLKTVKDSDERQQQCFSTDTASTSVVVAPLMDLGVTEKVARELATRYPVDSVLAQIDMIANRKAIDPAAVLVTAIREEWAPPAGYEPPEEREARARREEEERARREEAHELRSQDRESWRERMVAEHGIDDGTMELWDGVRRRLGRYVGPSVAERLFGRALLLPPSGRCARVLVEGYAQKYQVGAREREALETELAAALGRRVEVEVAWAS